MKEVGVLKKNLGGKNMTSEELERINLECDLIDLVNRYAWPQSAKIVKELMAHYNVTRKNERVPIHVISKANATG